LELRIFKWKKQSYFIFQLFVLITAFIFVIRLLFNPYPNENLVILFSLLGFSFIIRAIKMRSVRNMEYCFVYIFSAALLISTALFIYWLF
jgi:hypothetical protein